MITTIFLDIDGPMIPYHKMRGNRLDDRMHNFQESSVRALNKITDNLDCEIVISSTWKSRGLETLKKVFQKRGVTGKIVDMTSGEGSRGYEIKEYIDKNNIEDFVIIDDECFSIYQEFDIKYWRNIIQVNRWRGLDDFDVEYVIGKQVEDEYGNVWDFPPVSKLTIKKNSND